jgi:hypothetical protein
MADQDLFTNVDGVKTDKTPLDIPAPTALESDLVSKLVGDGKKFKDVDALAKGKLESDAFIERLQKENEDLRKVADKNLTLESILEAIKKPTDDKPKGNADTPPTASAADVDARITKVLNDRDVASRATANLTKVHDTMVKVLGSKDKAVEAIAKKAVELGTTTQLLKTLAIETPDAFLKLMDINTTAVGGTPNMASTVNSGALGSGPDTDGRTYAYYEKLRKDKPREYMTPKIQNQMHKDMESMGSEKFFGRKA